jgi:hypothetical protein
MITLLLILLIFLNLPPAAPLIDQLVTLAFALVSMAPIQIAVEYFSYQSALRRARQEPIIWPMDQIELHWLLRELRDFRYTFTEYAANVLQMPELAKAKTTVHRSRPHPDKKAYSIKIVSEVVLKSKMFSAFIRPERMTLTIEIIGESIKGPHIVCAWFDSPKSIFLAKSAVRVINFEKDEICRLLCCRLDWHTSFISMPRKIRTDRDEEKTLLQYWPVLQKNYHIRVKDAKGPAQLFHYKRKFS